MELEHSDHETPIEPIDKAEVAIGVAARVTGRFTRFMAKHSTYFARQMEISAACSCGGVCPTCVGVTAGSTLLPMVFDRQPKQPDE